MGMVNMFILVFGEYNFYSTFISILKILYIICSTLQNKNCKVFLKVQTISINKEALLLKIKADVFFDLKKNERCIKFPIIL